ncbi:hypothetical protein SODALDRAFT_331768 [Sodiomyces alkalinus F11]|uniref:Uncharacterized protein n=1 Tax=Sodiomyces alkalinus (strain CBS 110278 / VKM F-3762 / F11) TaxID=1314773 RepID=A0A3N2PZ03_SODAK|nr:hypothetical protein SODALDRAFT_331768 [Sodiomyces alkalinus F11]ROT39658.1 hypothetical protein SODALDRAFT_331768 [Sodiomyces alkalinus F11]
MPRHQDMDDPIWSIRFKHGVHTVLLFIDSMKPFSEVTSTLLEILRERYPDGLTLNHTDGAPSTKLPPPGSDMPRIAYGVPHNPNDLSQGWRELPVRQTDIPLDSPIKNNGVVAFTFVSDDRDELEEVDFVVDVPSFEDEYDENEEQEK